MSHTDASSLGIYITHGRSLSTFRHFFRSRLGILLVLSLSTCSIKYDGCEKAQMEEKQKTNEFGLREVKKMEQRLIE